MVDTVQEVADQFGRGITDLAQIYLPTLRKMTVGEIVSLHNLILEKKLDEAKQLLYTKMTNDEVVAEKEKLAFLTLEIAQDNYKRRQFAQELMLAVLKAALGILLAAAFL